MRLQAWQQQQQQPKTCKGLWSLACLAKLQQRSHNPCVDTNQWVPQVCCIAYVVHYCTCWQGSVAAAVAAAVASVLACPLVQWHTYYIGFVLAEGCVAITHNGDREV
jgi:hypothetical protein